MSNLLGKFGIILNESPLSWLEGSYTRFDLVKKKKEQKPWSHEKQTESS